MLELLVAMVLLSVGLFGMAGMSAMQSRQIRQLERWCVDDPIYYVETQPNRWLRKQELPAEMTDESGQEPWTPGVFGDEAYELAVGTPQRDLTDGTASAEVELTEIDPDEGEDARWGRRRGRGWGWGWHRRWGGGRGHGGDDDDDD